MHTANYLRAMSVWVTINNVANVHNRHTQNHDHHKMRCTNYDFHYKKKIRMFLCGQKVDIPAVTLKNHKINRNATRSFHSFFSWITLMRCVMPWIIFHFECIIPQEFQVFLLHLDFFLNFFLCCLLFKETTGFIHSN